jgi:hypothetical protein
LSQSLSDEEDYEKEGEKEDEKEEEDDEEYYEQEDDEIKLIDTEDDITVEELYQALTKMLQKNPSSGKKIVKHVEFGSFHNTRSVRTTPEYLYFVEY